MPSNTPKRTAYTGPPMSGPGIIYTTSKIVKPEELSPEKFNWWYENVHIRDLLATGVVSRAFRFKNNNASADTPYLAIYVLEDMAALQQAAFKSVPQTHESLPGGGPAHRFVDFDTRYYQLIQKFEVEEHPTGEFSFSPESNIRCSKSNHYEQHNLVMCIVAVQIPQSTKLSSDWYPALISGAVEPAEGGDDDLDRWYREEHLNQATTQPGWKRTTRYKLIFQVRNDPGPQNSEDAPKWLALHEWDKGYLGPEVQPFQPMSEWTSTVMSNARNIQANNYEKIGSFGL